MSPTTPLSVLVVDDDPDAADSTGTLLTLYGHTPRVARSCAEALAAADEFTPDVALLDLGLPDGDGAALAGAMRARLGRRPVLVAVTGFQGRDADARRAGFDHVFLKPLDPRELEALLRRYAGRAAVEAA